MAHIGFFRTEFVERKRWLSDEQFGHLLAICQFLPGPASSQLGFAIGLLRAGWLGALSAFIAFTLPSVVLLFAFASALPMLSGELGNAAIHGLKLVACAVVADAVLGMAVKLCPDARRKTIAIFATVILVITSFAYSQVLVVACAALAGSLFLPQPDNRAQTQGIKLPYGKKSAAALSLCFLALLFGLPLLATGRPELISLAGAFYQAGALVFGGGHVVLPLLESSMVNSAWVNSEQFLAGYGASQAIPGPMFAFSAYLGALASPAENTYAGAAVALVFMFLPGFLLIGAVLPMWQAVSQNNFAQRAIAGVNAGVVGLLAAALYDPIFVSGISNSTDIAIVITAFAMLSFWRLSALYAVLWCVTASILVSLF